MTKELTVSRLRSSALIAIAIIVAACSSGSNGRAATSSAGPDALTISANHLAFSTDALAAPSGKPFQIAFDNLESAPHNVAIYKDSSAAEKVFGSDPFGGPASVVYDVPAQAPGTYFFRCDVHPD